MSGLYLYGQYLVGLADQDVNFMATGVSEIAERGDYATIQVVSSKATPTSRK